MNCVSETEKFEDPWHHTRQILPHEVTEAPPIQAHGLRQVIIWTEKRLERGSPREIVRTRSWGVGHQRARCRLHWPSQSPPSLRCWRTPTRRRVQLIGERSCRGAILSPTSLLIISRRSQSRLPSSWRLSQSASSSHIVTLWTRQSRGASPGSSRSTGKPYTCAPAALLARRSLPARQAGQLAENARSGMSAERALAHLARSAYAVPELRHLHPPPLGPQRLGQW